METLFVKLFFPLPPSFFVNTLSVMNIPSYAMIGLSEIRGQNLKYSKFANTQSSKERHDNTAKLLGQTDKVKVRSKTGMIIAYAPALVVSLALFAVFRHENDLRMLMLISGLAVHFFKRICEVLFVHKYSGTMDLETSCLISLSYFTSTSTMIYAQHLSQGIAEPQIDLKYIGVVFFLTGIIGNFYHHNLLSKLRENGEEKYKIPKGGLFDLVICPHYLFEIMEYLGFYLISQTAHSFSVALGTMFYLVGRSCATRQWYLSKFETFPKHVKALIPFVL